ncbi:MAG: AAA-like domain-containing protein [Clostridiales bacterium]|nr:AAA-like domain-containing protein [Clostridiales bacterium]
MRTFNTTGACFPDVHYMVNINSKLAEIRKLIDNGSYFVINRPRQYGKTTTLGLLSDYLWDSYIVISLDFQSLSDAKFKNEYVFSSAFAKDLLRTVRNHRRPVLGLSREVLDKLQQEAATGKESFGLVELFVILSELCETAEKPIVLLIDEVDSASNNQVFLDFLAQLRSYYLKRYRVSAFRSVILAGVYDIKNLKSKIRPEDEHRFNSPWNTRESNEENGSSLTFDDCPRNQMDFFPFDFAESFSLDMSFSANDISGMLKDYENDHQTGMNIPLVAKCIYDYTSGYPFLVSCICKMIDEQFQKKFFTWTESDIADAVNTILTERSTLFDSMIHQLEIYPELRDILYKILFQGQRITFNPDNEAVSFGTMFGYVFNQKGSVSVSNRIFEMRLYNLFLFEEELNNLSHKGMI